MTMSEIEARTDMKSWMLTLTAVCGGAATLISALTVSYTSIFPNAPHGPPIVVKPDDIGPAPVRSILSNPDDPIGQKWTMLRAASGALGLIKTGQRKTLQDGVYVEFTGGFVFWRQALGAVAIFGAIADKWKEMDFGRAFGYPLADEADAAVGGRFNDFETGNSIYYHPEHGTHAVIGAIGVAWKKAGHESGSCGFPTSDEFDEYHDNKIQRADFQFGFIRWERQINKVQVECYGNTLNIMGVKKL